MEGGIKGIQYYLCSLALVVGFVGVGWEWAGFGFACGQYIVCLLNIWVESR